MLKIHLPPKPYSLQSKGQGLSHQSGLWEALPQLLISKAILTKRPFPQHTSCSVLGQDISHWLLRRSFLSTSPRDEQLLPSFLKLLMMFAEGIDVLSVANLL